MSIAAGFLCTDGILMCADTEMSGGIKYESNKIKRYVYEGFGEIVVAGAGQSSYVGMGRDWLDMGFRKAALNLIAIKNGDDRLVAVERVLADVSRFLRRHIIEAAYYPNANTVLEMLVGVNITCDQPRIALFHIHYDSSIERVGEFAVIGSGEYVAASYLRILVKDESYPMDVMTAIALFVIYEAKKSAEGVGGSSHVFRIPSPSVTRWWDDLKVASLVEDAMRLCLVDSRNVTEISRDVLEARARDLVRRILDVRSSSEPRALPDQVRVFLLKTFPQNRTPDEPKES